ncbi:MAG: hypothetical protein ACYTGO_08920, partial [Planctomycetota bacterium]
MADDRPAGICAWLLILMLSLAAPASAAAVPGPGPTLGPQAPGSQAPGLQEVHAKASPKDHARLKNQDEAGVEAEDKDTNATQGAEPSTWLLLATGLGVLVLFH